METGAPWIKNYGDIPFHLEYPDDTMWGCFEKAALAEGNNDALIYMGKHYSYATVLGKVERTAAAFAALGVREGTRVAVCLPNMPQAVYCVYALNKLGATACMVHPLSAIHELTELLKEADCCFAVILDSFAYKFHHAAENIPGLRLIVTTGADELGLLKNTAYRLFSGRKHKKDMDKAWINWADFIKSGKGHALKPAVADRPKEAAVVLFSGGTTGVPKGIALSNRNLNALALQTNAICKGIMGHRRMLAVLPVFHGFGLGICVHAPLIHGGTSVLIPRIQAHGLAKFLEKERINFFIGVPTLFEALVRDGEKKKPDLSRLMGAFSGGDCMTLPLKKKVNAFFKACGTDTRVQEGYGATECVAASCLTPYFSTNEEGIGFPYPDMYFKICDPESGKELPCGTDGEICLRGPTVMLGYLKHPEENEKVLRIHEDGHTYLHTGDMGCMDEDGCFYFRQRIKRMIVTSGYNVYPNHLENILGSHPKVRQSCVIGVPDPYKIQKVKAFVVPADGVQGDEALKAELIAYLKLNVAKYALPYTIEFREDLPKTKLNKIDYRALERE